MNRHNFIQVQLRKHGILLVCCSQIVLLSVLAVDKLYEFRVQSYDMAIFNQLFWNTLHGKFMYTLPECCVPQNPPNFLGTHFAPIIFLLLPIYYMYQSPYTLLVIQAAFLSLPLLYINKMVAKLYPDRHSLRSLFVFAYALYPALWYVNLSDFHLEALIPLPFIMAYYYWFIERNARYFTLSFIFLLSTIEYSAFLGFAFLAYAWLKENKLDFKVKTRFDLLLVVLLIATISYWLIANDIMASSWPQRSIYAPQSYWSLSNFFTDLNYKILYWMILLVPLLFLPFLAPLESLVLSGPWLIGSFFSNYSPYYVILWQYPALAIGPLFIAGIVGAKKLPRDSQIVKTVGVVVLITFVALGPLGIYASENYPSFQPSLPGYHAYAGHQILQLIPSNASVLTENDILEFLVQRGSPVFSKYPLNLPPPDYILADTTQPLFFHNDPSDAPMIQQLQYFTSHYGYGVYGEADGYLLYRLNYTGQPKLYLPFKSFIPGTSLAYYTPTKGKSLIVPFGYNGFAWKGPWMALGPGQYEVNFLLSYDGPSSNTTVITLDAIYYAGGETFARTNVTVSELHMDTVTGVPLLVNITRFTPSAEFRGYVQGNQTGGVDLLGIQITQVGLAA